MIELSRLTSLGDYRADLASKAQKIMTFFKRMLESCKFGVRPFSCVRIDCRCRRRPETRYSWSKTRICSSETAKYKESQWKITEITDWCDLRTYSWMMPNNIKKQCQTYQIKKSIFTVIFHWDPLYSAVLDEQILVLTRKIWFLVFSDSDNRFGYMRKVRPQIYRSLAWV